MGREAFYGITDQGKASHRRRDDAHALMGASRWRGAMYLAGYRVECILKARLMRKFGCANLRELEDALQKKGRLAQQASIFTHNLGMLLGLTGRREAMRQNEQAWRHFNVVNTWLPAWRYSPVEAAPEEATSFLAAVDGVAKWIENNV